jgi:hypothetical protein
MRVKAGVVLDQSGGEVPEAHAVASIRLVEAGGLQLGAGRPEQDLRCRGERFVVEVAQHDGGAFISVAVEQRVGAGANCDRFGGAACERVVAVARALALVLGLESAGERQELGLEVAGDEVELVTVGADADAARRAASRRSSFPGRRPVPGRSVQETR